MKGFTPGRSFDVPQLFDPEDGITVFDPPGNARGYWIGAPGAFYDEDEDAYYLYHRVRIPRGAGSGGPCGDRGYECRIARSEDGVKFEPIWSAAAKEIGSPSVERSALTRTDDGCWRLYISYVDGSDNRWRVDLLEAGRPDQFRLTEGKKVFTADEVKAHGVKDPWVFRANGRWHMIVSVAPRIGAIPGEDQTGLHDTGDAYATGKITSHTGLAVSGDGVHFDYLGLVMSPPKDTWDCYCTRVNSLLHCPPGFLAFYDGATTVAENYEEKAALAWTFDLRHFTRITSDGPLMKSPHASGCIRYTEALAVQDRILFYYEYTRPDGSHELRVSRVRRS